MMFAVKPDLSETLTEMVTIPWAYSTHEHSESDVYYVSFEISDSQQINAFDLYSDFIWPSLRSLAHMLSKFNFVVVWPSNETYSSGVQVLNYGDESSIPVEVTVVREKGKTVYSLYVMAKGQGD